MKAGGSFDSRRIGSFCLIATLTAGLIGGILLAPRPSRKDFISPIYGVEVPAGYRKWEFIAPAHEAGLNELRVVVGNDIAIKAYREGTLPFPDGTILVKLAWKRVPSSEIDEAFVPGAATTVQVMVKDSKRYAATGGWGFGRFVDGKPAPEAQHETCYSCHDVHVQNHDLVFTRWAP
jgi:Cytochrome P460